MSGSWEFAKPETFLAPARYKYQKTQRLTGAERKINNKTDLIVNK